MAPSLPVKPRGIGLTYNFTGLCRQNEIISSMASKPINIRWKRTGSQPHFKSCIASNWRQFSMNIKIKIFKVIPVLLVPEKLEICL